MVDGVRIEVLLVSGAQCIFKLIFTVSLIQKKGEIAGDISRAYGRIPFRIGRVKGNS